MSEISERAATTYQAGFTCSQSVLSAFAPDLGLSTELALKVAAPFGGGIARRGEICGALSGALMVIGLKTGDTTGTDKDAKEYTVALSREMVGKFKKQNGALTCRELLNCDISIASELQRARDTQLFATICPRLVASAAEIAEELIDE